MMLEMVSHYEALILDWAAKQQSEWIFVFYGVCIFSQTDLVYNNVSVEGYSVKIIV
jgi:hypothetical protein